MSLAAQIVIALILLVAGFGCGIKFHAGVIAQRDLAARDARESDERQQRALGDRKAVQHASTLATVNNQLGAARAHIATIDSRQCLDADTVRLLNNIGPELPAPSNALHHVSLHWVDIENGWAAFELAIAVRNMRTLGKHFILDELTPAGPPLEQLPLSDDDFAALKQQLNGLPPDLLAIVKANWPAHIPTPKAHVAGQPILRGHAPEIHQLIDQHRRTA